MSSFPSPQLKACSLKHHPSVIPGPASISTNFSNSISTECYKKLIISYGVQCNIKVLIFITFFFFIKHKNSLQCITLLQRYYPFPQQNILPHLTLPFYKLKAISCAPSSDNFTALSRRDGTVCFHPLTYLPWCPVCGRWWVRYPRLLWYPCERSSQSHLSCPGSSRTGLSQRCRPRWLWTVNATVTCQRWSTAQRWVTTQSCLEGYNVWGQWTQQLPVNTGQQHRSEWPRKAVLKAIKSEDNECQPGQQHRGEQPHKAVLKAVKSVDSESQHWLTAQRSGHHDKYRWATTLGGHSGCGGESNSYIPTPITSMRWTPGWVQSNSNTRLS